jgi:hypothetical protein
MLGETIMNTTNLRKGQHPYFYFILSCFLFGTCLPMAFIDKLVNTEQYSTPTLVTPTLPPGPTLDVVFLCSTWSNHPFNMEEEETYLRSLVAEENSDLQIGRIYGVDSQGCEIYYTEVWVEFLVTLEEFHDDAFLGSIIQMVLTVMNENEDHAMLHYLGTNHIQSFCFYTSEESYWRLWELPYEQAMQALENGLRGEALFNIASSNEDHC